MDKNEPEIKSTQMLKDALADSELLLSYASEQGLILDSKYVKSIIKAKKDEQNNSWTEQDEIDFWLAFQTISKLIQPVCIDSLRAASIPQNTKKNWWQTITFQKPKSVVNISVSWYRRLALFFMIIMLALQIYGIIGAALMAKVTSNNDRMIEIEKRMTELILVASANAEDRTAAMEKNNLENEHQELSDELQSSIELTHDWLNFTANVWSRSTKEISNSVSNTLPDSLAIPVEVSFGASNNVVIIQQATSLIIILNQYVLPLLYGLLGGFAFVLRSISDETKRMVYTSDSDIKFGLRIHLGALAGLVIGFLWGDFQGKSFGLVESLSPLAVAFLAGYSVDFLFRMLDSIIGNVVKKEAAPATPAEPVKKC